VEIAVQMHDSPAKYFIAIGALAVALWFVYRSFYRMRIPEDSKDDAVVQVQMKVG